MNEKNIKLENIQEKYINEILDCKKKLNLEKIYNVMLKNEICILKYNEKNYPQSLINIIDFPIYLFVRGNTKNLNSKMHISIVGSRNSSEYGRNIAREMSYNISKRNINVVSGLAIGIDKYAHLGSLDAKSSGTIAVLASSVLKDDFYPTENLKVFERILEQDGTIISEYYFKTKLEKYKFVERNRIISGLSKKIVVIEAGVNSGSLITADFALEQGKDVFVVPRKYKYKKLCR